MGSSDKHIIQRLVDILVERLMPHRHAEIRPGRFWLVMSLVALLFAGLFIWSLATRPQLPQRSEVTVIVVVTAGLGLVLAIPYFRFQVHFRSHGIHIYQWGRHVEMLPYRSFARAELGYWNALRLVRPDGTFWRVPNAEDQDILTQVLWRIDHAGLPIPSKIALRNRFGFDSLSGGALTRFRKARHYR